MKLAIFGATGALGSQCLGQCLDAGHEVTVLVRSSEKLPSELRDRVRIVEGDALDPRVVEEALSGGVEGVLFAIGVDKSSPEDLCADVTRHIVDAMPRLGVRRFVFCGGGSTIVPGDVVTFGARFVRWFATTFMALRQRDKVHQLEFLEAHRDVAWLGLRPLQMRQGARRGEYRIGYDAFSGFSKIHFADCADAMIAMLTDDTWLHQAPIIQY